MLLAAALRNAAEYSVEITVALFGEIIGRVINEYPAIGDNDCARTNCVDLLKDMCRYHDEFLLGHRPDELPDFVFLVRVETIGRFVKYEHIGVVQDCLRKPDAALEAFGERIDRLTKHWAEVQEFNDHVQAGTAVTAREFTNICDEIEELSRRHLGIQGGAFGQVSDASLRSKRIRLDVVSTDRCASVAGRNKSCDHLHGRGFTGAVRPKESQDLPGFAVKAQVVNDCVAAIPLCQAIRF
jgi:hypothetical protein